MQKVTAIGRLGADPERKQAGNSSVTELRLAVSNGKDRDGNDQTTWWRVSVWGKQGEWVAGKVGKGNRVVVDGRLMPPKIFQKNNGEHGLDLTINCDNITVIDYKDDEPKHKDVSSGSSGGGWGSDPVPF